MLNTTPVRHEYGKLHIRQYITPLMQIHIMSRAPHIINRYTNRGQWLDTRCFRCNLWQWLFSIL